MIENPELSEEIDSMFERSDQRIHEIYSMMLRVTLKEEAENE